MELIIFLILAFFVLVAICICATDEYKDILLPPCVFAGFVVFGILFINVVNYTRVSHGVKVYNQMCQTNYTANDFFWSKNYIEKYGKCNKQFNCFKYEKNIKIGF